MIYEISKKDLYITENGVRELVAKMVSELILPSPDKQRIVYIEEANSHYQGQRLMCKETGKQPECIAKHARICGLTSDLKYVLFTTEKGLYLLTDLTDRQLIVKDVGMTTFLVRKDDGQVVIVYSKHVKKDYSYVVDLYRFDGVTHERVVQGADWEYRIYHDEKNGFRVLFTKEQSNDYGALSDLLLYEHGVCHLLVSGVDDRFSSNIAGDQVVYFEPNPNDENRYFMKITSITPSPDRPNVILSECDRFDAKDVTVAFSHMYGDGNWIEFDRLSNYYEIKDETVRIYHALFGTFQSVESKGDLYRLYFNKSVSKKYYLAVELARRASEHVIIESEWEWDDSENHIVGYTEDQLQDLAIMDHNLDSIFASGSIMSYQIFGIDIKTLLRSCETFIGNVHRYCSPVTLFSNYIGLVDRDPAFTRYVEEVRDRLKEIFHCDNYQRLQLHLLNNYDRPKRKENFRSKERINKYLYETDQDYKNLKEELKKVEETMILEDRLPTRWKSEQELFKLIKRNFPTATMHASPEWLSPQHLDVYVEEECLAFEYQGVQHFNSVDHFGGTEAFARRLELDERKKKKCENNQVELIEWIFNEPLTKDVLKKKLSQIGKKI